MRGRRCQANSQRPAPDRVNPGRDPFYGPLAATNDVPERPIAYVGPSQPRCRGHLIHWARFYDRCVFLCTLGRAGAMREEAADLAAIRPGESVLEVGCSTGELTRRARERAGSGAVVCGIDPSAE